MIHLSHGYLDIHPLILIFAPLVVFMSIFCQNNAPSYQLNLLNILGYFAYQKDFLCYDLDLFWIRVSRNVIFEENTYFFATNHDTLSSSSISLPLFPISFIGPTSPKPLLVSQRRQVVIPNQPPTPSGRPLDYSLVVDPVLDPESTPL